MNRFVNNDQDLENNAFLDGKPVKCDKFRCNRVIFAFSGDKTSSCTLNVLQTVQESATDTSKQTITIV